MFNFNKKPIPEDRIMTWEEEATFPIELQEAALSSLIEVKKKKKKKKKQQQKKKKKNK